MEFVSRHNSGVRDMQARSTNGIKTRDKNPGVNTRRPKYHHALRSKEAIIFRPRSTAPTKSKQKTNSQQSSHYAHITGHRWPNLIPLKVSLKPISMVSRVVLFCKNPTNSKLVATRMWILGIKALLYPSPSWSLQFLSPTSLNQHSNIGFNYFFLV